MTEEELIAKAVADGYPDKTEVCPADGCGAVFKNYHHFINCGRDPCPLSTGKTLFEHWAEMDAVERTKSERGLDANEAKTK